MGVSGCDWGRSCFVHPFTRRLSGGLGQFNPFARKRSRDLENINTFGTFRGSGRMT